MFGNGDERLYNLGVELSFSTFQQSMDRLAVRKPFSVAAVGNHCIVGINDRDNTGDDGDVVPFQSCGIAGSIEVLVMMQGVQAGLFEPWKQTQNGPAIFGMP